MDTWEAIKGRSSIRAFLDKAVSRDIIEKILDISRWAPSGGNLQPWRVAVVTGQTKQRITEEIFQAVDAGIKAHPDYSHYPETWFEPYQSRRFACGMALYKALNIGRKDVEGRKQAWRQNYMFFGAPVGLFFFVDRGMSRGAWIDMGMFIQTVMLAVHGFGLGSCPQASLTDFPDIVRRNLKLADEWVLVCGLSLGYPDRNAPVNQYRIEREATQNFCQWYE